MLRGSIFSKITSTSPDSIAISRRSSLHTLQILLQSFTYLVRLQNHKWILSNIKRISILFQYFLESSSRFTDFINDIVFGLWRFSGFCSKDKWFFSNPFLHNVTNPKRLLWARLQRCKWFYSQSSSLKSRRNPLLVRTLKSTLIIHTLYLCYNIFFSTLFGKIQKGWEKYLLACVNENLDR